MRDAGWFASRPLTDIRLSFLVAHVAQEDEDEMRRRDRRDAAVMLNLAMLLNGSDQGKERTWRSLVSVLKDEPTRSREDDRAEMQAMEKMLFTELNEYWQGAIPERSQHGGR